MKENSKTWTEELEEIQLEIAHLEWSRERDQRLLDELAKRHQEVCGEIGHEMEDAQCINCGWVDPRDYDEPEDDDYDSRAKDLNRGE